MTTFRLVALDALELAVSRLPSAAKISRKQPVLDPVAIDLADAPTLDEETRRRLLGRYGADAAALVVAAHSGELEPIPGTTSLWAELRWAARAEGVVHLDDLLLRRVRVGLLTDAGGWPIMERIRDVAQSELGWDDARWGTEVQRYADLWRQSYSTPEGAPDVVEAVIPALQTLEPGPVSRNTRPLQIALLGVGLLTSLILIWQLIRRRGLVHP